MRALTRVITLADGTLGLEEYLKPRVSTNLSAGGAQSVDAGVATHDKEMHFSTVQNTGRAAATANTAFALDHPPQSQPIDPGKQPHSGAKRPRQDTDPPQPRPEQKPAGACAHGSTG